ncbi:peptidase domain-containing ABC transporter [Leptolyngbya ohadii]|uniref:peptidase domain-containing ABC transporter n=1 Tax=Leptolyngbya ohadii TaxID=1962290 RepID=UPI000B59880F|nr:peptidase domain-containing ABC transporter [Leptolyngbya ohadii]
MTSVNVSLQPFVAQFFSTWLFSPLPEEVRKAIAAQLQLCSFYPGAVIHSAKELPSAIHYVIQGRVRILGAATYHSPTLEVAEPGAIVGWDSLLRRVCSGSARAAIQVGESAEDQEILTLSLSADTFESLALQYLMPTLGDRLSSLELFDTLTRFLTSLPTRSSDIQAKDLVRYIEHNQLAIVQHIFSQSLKSGSPLNLNSLNPLRSNSLNSHSQNADFLAADRIWLLSGGDHLPVPPGTVIQSMRELCADDTARFPFRLIGIDRDFLSSVLIQGQIPAAEVAPSGLPPISLLPASGSAAVLPPSSPGSTEISTEIAAPAFSPASSDYPVWRSPLAEPIEDIVACLGMICSWFRVPYRPDFLRQWLRRRALEDWDGLEVCSRIAEAIGLRAEAIHFTPTAGGLNRLPTPCLLQCQQILVVLYEVTPTTAIVASPRTGLLRLKTAELAARLESDRTGYDTASNQPGDTCRAIVLERLPHTPTKQFDFQWFVPILLTQRGILIQVLIASLFIQLLNLANPLLVQQVIDSVIVAANPNAMTMFGILMLLCAFFEGGLSILRMYLFASTANRVDLHLGIEIVRHLLHLPLPFFEQRPVGELSARLSELENIRQFLTSTALTVVLDVIFSLFYIAVMFLYSSRLAWCVMLSIPVIVISTLLVAAIQKKLIRAKSDRHAKVQAYLVEVLGGIFTVKAQHIEPLVEATWRDRYVQYLSSGFKTATVGTLFSSFNSFLSTVSSLLVLWVGADLVLKGELTLGGLIAFRILAGYVTAPLLRLASLWQRFQETSLSMELLADIADAPMEELEDRTQLQLPAIRGHVQYSDVSFAFRAGTPQLNPQLTNVHLNIAPASFVGIVGQSGSGKSTLMKLLPRLYTPQTGRIYLDGYDVSKVSLDSLRQQIGIVPQDAVLFEGTIRDNIALFEPISDAAVIEAATIAEAHDFIMQLPDGYNTPVGERGGSLSGGQRQRIAIARVVARNPKLLIFDEATSALDYETEKRVCENLMQRFRDRTCFFITHRLNTITCADWILLMQSGMIVEQGTHQQLMRDRQLYYGLYQQQSRHNIHSD